MKSVYFIIRIKILNKEKICGVNLSRLSSASCSGLIWTVTQRRSVDGSEGARGREWDGSDQSREREIPCSLTPTLIFSLPLAVFCLWYLTLQQWDPSKQRVTPTFPHRLSPLRKISSFRLPSSLRGRQKYHLSIKAFFNPFCLQF